MKLFFQSITLIGCFVSSMALAQLPSNRIRPGTMYYQGDTVKSPRLGVTSIIPEGWEGVLPRDTEVFLLMSNTVNGEIYVAVNENTDKAGQITRWKEGMDLDDGLRLMPDGEITSRGDVLCGPAKVTGNKGITGNKFYLEAKCSPSGFCLSYMLMTSDAASFEKVKKAMQLFVDNTSFRKPSTESPFAHFDWNKFLSGKVLLNIDYEQTSKREDEVNFCADGNFTSKITRKGVFKEQAKDYKGNKKGTWKVESKGDKASLTFSFEKLAPVTVNMEIRDENIYVNGKRYFIGSSETCK
jgi:hypothetical protein